MPFFIVRQDITKMKTDAIVNAANTALQMGGGVCGAIFQAAGAKELQAACDALSPIRTGEAAITPGFSLPAKYVIHAAGPVYNHQKQEQCRRQLYSAYTESLKLAEAHGCKSIAFPLISSGIYGYPKEEALVVAREAIEAYLAGYGMEVWLAVFDKTSFCASKKLLDRVESYIDEHYVDGHTRSRRGRLAAKRPAMQEAAEPEMLLRAGGIRAMQPAAAGVAVAAAGIDSLLNQLDAPFSDTLLKLIDTKGKTDVEVYQRANIDRKLFSKIRTGKGYTPKKPTILALAVALELTLPETEALLKRAGYALSHASKFDVIVEYFIGNGSYNIFEINEVLFTYDQPLLGSQPAFS